MVEESLGQRPLAMLSPGGLCRARAAAGNGRHLQRAAYTGRQRVREIGSRMALGAPVRA